MKRKYSVVLFVIFLTITQLSCDSEENTDLIQKVNYKELTTGLLSYDNEKVKTEFVKITNELIPANEPDDQIGHLENFKKLIDELNTCELISSELLCYACIKTFPPQSELMIVIDSSGQSVKRIIDILTPSDSLLTFVRVHE